MEGELKVILGQIRSLILANREMGLDPPPLPKYVLYNEEEKNILGGLDRSGPLHEVRSLEELRAHIGDCRRCKLHKRRNRLVFGEGSAQARVVFVGEGPGADEDMAGRPFVGEAGQLLTRIIQNGMGLNRKEVYICNVVKCRPPGNRDPEPDEIETCLPFLKKQVEIIRPEAICALGRVANEALSGIKNFRISRGRGKWYDHQNVPVMPTYHPAYVLRNPSQTRKLKGEVWEDIKKMMAHLDLEVRRNE